MADQDPFNQFDQNPQLQGLSAIDDDKVLKKMGTHTTLVGRIVGPVLLIGIAAVLYIVFTGNEAFEKRMDGVEACGSQPDEAGMLACLRTEFKNTKFEDVKHRILKNLAIFGDKEALPLFVEGLDEPGLVRREAALGLAKVGLPDAEVGRKKLLAVLPDTDEQDRNQVVWALAVLGEGGAAEAILEAFTRGALQDQPGFSPKIITDVLGFQRLSSEALLTHEEESVRQLTAAALAELASPEVIEPLGKLIDAELARAEDKQSTEVLRTAAAGLGRTGDARAAQPLFALLDKKPSVRAGVLDALAKSTGAPALAVMVTQAREAGLKRDLVRLVAESYDRRAIPTLAALLNEEDEEIRDDAAVALANFGDVRCLDVLLANAKSEDDAKATEALRALKALANPAATPGLLDLLPANACPPEPGPDMPQGCYRQATILAALGTAGDASAGKRVEMALDGQDAPAAAQALGQLQYEPAYRELKKRVVRPANLEMAASNAAERSLANEDVLQKRKGAIIAMGWYGRGEAAEPLMKVVEDEADDFELRGLAASALGKVADADTMATVVQKVRDTSVPENTRRYYLRALWQKPFAQLSGDLLSIMESDAPTGIRRAAAFAVGYAAVPANDERLMTMLEAERSRGEAALAIALGGGPDAVRKLIEALANDRETREVIQATMLSEDDRLNLVTQEMFETGQIWRRLSAARQLRDGVGEDKFTSTWSKTVAVLKSGWEAPGGADARFIRGKLYDSLSAGQAPNADMAAEIFGEMPLRGLLIQARDEGGAGAVAARKVLNAVNRN